MISNLFSFHIGSVLICVSRLPKQKNVKFIRRWKTDHGRVLQIGRIDIEIVAD